MTKQTHIKVGGVWKAVRVVWEKVSGSWKYCVIPWIKVSGTWRDCKDYSGVLPGDTPYVQCSGNSGYNPGSGWTGYLYHKIHTSSTSCTHSATINMTSGSNLCSIYMGLFGVHDSANCICEGDMDIKLTIVHPIYGTIEHTVKTDFACVKTNKSAFNIDLEDFDWGLHGTNWRTDDVGTFTIVSGSTTCTDHTDCP